MFGNNIKVHFAGCEQLGQYECAVDAGVRYSLFSVLSFISKKFGISAYSCVGVSKAEDRVRILKELNSEMRHVIMDSGLFTLMFGAHSENRDKKFVAHLDVSNAIINALQKQDLCLIKVWVCCKMSESSVFLGWQTLEMSCCPHLQQEHNAQQAAGFVRAGDVVTEQSLRHGHHDER